MAVARLLGADPMRSVLVPRSQRAVMAAARRFIARLSSVNSAPAPPALFGVYQGSRRSFALCAVHAAFARGVPLDRESVAAGYVSFSSSQQYFLVFLPGTCYTGHMSSSDSISLRRQSFAHAMTSGGSFPRFPAMTNSAHTKPNKTDAANRLEASIVLSESSSAGG